jgi:hypothetical protein
MPSIPLFPALPTIAADLAWEHYRDELRRCVNRGVISLAEFPGLLGVSYDEQLKLQNGQQRPAVAVFRPMNDALVALRGARIREAAVLTFCRSEGLSAPETMRLLERAGFAVMGARPLDVLRKALDSEVRGVVKRPPTLARSNNRYTYIRGSLSPRTIQRWNQRFPTLSSGPRFRHAA